MPKTENDKKEKKMIHIEHLYKKYAGKKVLNDITIDIGEGMYGLLGENGAGKSTLLKILATVLGKSKGIVELNKVPIENVTEIRKMIGYMPQEFSFYPGYTVFEIMEYFSALSCISLKKGEIDSVLNELHLLQEKNKKVKSLSGGMKRRLGIAVAIIHSPQFLLVDEPTVGLDPQERMNFRNLLVKLAKDRTILLSTHIISDIEETCERLAVLREGTIIFEGGQEKILKKMEGKVWEFTDELKKIEAFEEKRRDIKIVSRRVFSNNCTIRYMTESNAENEGMTANPRLEDAYIGLIDGRIKE